MSVLMSDTVIKVENISKFYQLGLINHDTLAKDLQGWWAKIRGKEDPNSSVSMLSSAKNNSDNDFIYALKDVSFDVKQGEVLGIIGANGAGKSTLLKILSRVTSPTSGCIKIKGRIGSLLEVGTGFHPELTGRENIYLNGAILGMRKHEIDRKLDEIIDFSGVEKFIDTPVKRYSSGMYVRLAFAVAAHLDPEILVVDEVLAVGDADFQKKCLGKMDDVSKKEGRTVLFVSHNMAAVRQLCTRGILLRNGMIAFVNTADECVDYYLNSAQTHNLFSIKERTDRVGNGVYKISEIKIMGMDSDFCLNDDIPLTIEINFLVRDTVINPRIGISINTMRNNVCVLWLDSHTNKNNSLTISRDTTLKIKITKDFALAADEYFVNVVCYDSFGNIADYIQHAVEFKVARSTFCKSGIYPLGKSVCLVNQEWTVE